ncbi:TetR/AcrR family transcriptional regulator [Streptomyces nogalater]
MPTTKTPTTKPLREGSARKRAAILSAARELFLADGFDRTSVDAVAARAKVSKRTVYDYFGDKQTLLRAVVDAIGESMISMIRRTLDDTLDDHTEAMRP